MTNMTEISSEHLREPVVDHKIEARIEDNQQVWKVDDEIDSPGQKSRQMVFEDINQKSNRVARDKQ
jgi:hypothetical protein